MTAATINSARTRQVPHRIELPRRWPWLIRGFRKYCKRYIRKHLHALRLSNASYSLPNDDAPILVVLNHPSWWDPLIGVALSERFGKRDHFAAMDAVAVERYAFFKHIGFVGVDTTSLRGAADFLHTGQTILADPHRVFWVTAQGRFTDVRERPLGLHAGVGHLAARLDRGWIVPIALEYTFWTERTAEALARFGEPLSIAMYPSLTGKQWLNRIERALTQTLDDLNAEAMSRDPERFTTLIDGNTGVGGVYDVWRRLKAWVRRERFDPSHGAVMRKAMP